MRTLFRFAFFAVLAISPSLSAAEHQPSVAAGSESPAADSSAAGEYVGMWRNDSDTGKVRLSLKRDGAHWTAVASFTFQEAEIPAKVTGLKVNGSKIEMVLAWVIQESPGQSRMIGELSGTKIDGTFESETPDGTSSGTWSVTRA